VLRLGYRRVGADVVDSVDVVDVVEVKGETCEAVDDTEERGCWRSVTTGESGTHTGACLSVRP
jgi:hypothetical protein